jgi:SAM-dependent methyltransferase
MSGPFDRLNYTGDGLLLRSYRLDKYVAGLPKKYPHLFLKKIDLRKVLMGGEAGFSSASYARMTGDLLWPSRSIVDSPYVELLNQYLAEGENLFLPDRFKTTSYYQNAAHAIELYGEYFGRQAPEDIVELARKFCRRLHAKSFNHEEPAETEFEPDIVVQRIKSSDCYQIVEGQHRLALAWVEGLKEHKCLVRPSSPVLTPIQQMIIDSSWTLGRPQVYQPIAAPELASWPMVRRCSDRFEMMMQWLEARAIHSGSFLDIGCSYGWFVDQMRRRGFQSTGVDRDAAAVLVGRLAYGLDAKATQLTDIINFLDSQTARYDIVSCFSVLHHFVRRQNRISAAELIRKVDDVTGSVLFFDTGEGHEEWFKASLPGWDGPFIQKWLRENSSFTRIEILGRDSDNVRPFEKNYRRHLFVCSRESE